MHIIFLLLFFLAFSLYRLDKKIDEEEQIILKRKHNQLLEEVIKIKIKELTSLSDQYYDL